MKINSSNVLLFGALLIGLSTFGQEDKSKITPPSRFDEVITKVNEMYVDDVNEEELTDAAIIALLEKLDPHSTFISKEEVAGANEKINGSFVGVGIRFQILKDTLMVVEAIPGGPCSKIGILAGDKIVSIDNENVAGIGLKTTDVRSKLLGERGTKVNVEILRRNSKDALPFTITRDRIPVHSVDAAYMLTPTTGYIKLNAFSRTTLFEVDESLRSLKKQGMKNLIFDLQGNGGGLLYAAQKLADEFLSGDKLIVYSEGRARPRQDLKAGDKGQFETGKLVLLTDEYSASASEIVSGAIQDWDRGLIVGRRTYGKGLVQQPVDLSDGSQIRLTIARYYTPSGRFIQKPYDDVDEYRKDLLNRYENGEFMHEDSINLPDSLRFKTLKTKRNVYGGGGIMPDIFVPLDTAELTDYYRALARSGVTNTFALSYVDKNRTKMKEQYPTFDAFKMNFNLDNQFMTEFFDFVEKEGVEVEFNEEEYKISERLLKVRIKALIAQNAWGYSEFYQVYNETNEILQRAIQVIESNEYSQMALDK